MKKEGGGRKREKERGPLCDHHFHAPFIPLFTLFFIYIFFMLKGWEPLYFLPSMMVLYKLECYNILFYTKHSEIN